MPIDAFVRTYFRDELTLDIPAFHDDFLETMQYIADRAIERKPGITITRIVPRGHAKSTYFTRFLPIHGMIYGWSRLTVLIANTDTAAMRLIHNIRETIEHCFPRLIGSTWNTQTLQTINGATLVAYGAGSGSIRGATAISRPQLVIADDLDDDQVVRSASELAARERWWDSAVMGLGDSIRHTTSYVVVGTLIGQTSLLSHIKGTAGTQTTLLRGVVRHAENQSLWEQWGVWFRAQGDDFPVDAESDEFYQQHKNEMNRGSIVLWPREDAYYYLMRFKQKNGERAFFCEIQNDPLLNSGKLGRLHRISIPANECKYWKRFASLDPTEKGNPHNDYAVWIELLQHTKTKQCCIDYVDAEIRSYDDTIEAILTRTKQPGVVYEKVFWEENGVGGIVLDMLLKRLRSEQRMVPIQRIHQSIAKELRIGVLEPELASYGLVCGEHIDDPELIREFESWPTGHDDVLDALSTIVIALNQSFVAHKGASLWN
jgi:hypothetical protein